MIKRTPVIPEDFDLFRHLRPSDPDTTLGAARKAARASAKATAAVEAVMSDGASRTDEEIWIACRTNGYIASSATVRHGRLALSEAKMLMDTGKRRDTADGSPSRVWVKVDVAKEEAVK